MHSCAIRYLAWVLLLSIACTAVHASGRSLLEDPPVTDLAAAAAAVADEQAISGDEEVADAQAVTPQVIRCKWKPDVYPRGYTNENWTAVWPMSCMGTPVGDPCRASCKQGYRERPPGYFPTVYCGPPKWKFGMWDTKVGGGRCEKIVVKPPQCRGQPPNVPHAEWVNCTRQLGGGNCTAVCDQGYVGDPAPPQADCVVDKSGLYATWRLNQTLQCKDSTVCRDSPCNEIAYAIRDSCVPNPAGDVYTCTCFDYYRWDPAQKICVDAQLLAFAVARPVDGTPRSYIYKYGATKATDIGKSRWLLQDNNTMGFNLYDVGIADSSTAWAVGSGGLIKKYDGAAWKIDKAGSTNAPDLLAVAALSKSRTWVGGAEGYASFWDGASWSDVSVDKGRSINSIAAVSDAASGNVAAWAVAGDERDPNHLWAYIYKWNFKGKKWELFQEFENITLRGVSALDSTGAWACGFTNRGQQDERAVVLVYDSNTTTWIRTVFRTWVIGYARLNDIVAIDYKRVYAAGYWESADAPTGNVPYGLVVQWDGQGWSTAYSGGDVYKFDAIAGISPSTTVAVGQYNDVAAEDKQYGYPAENWQKYRFQDRPMRKNTSVALDLAFSGIGMRYV